MTTTTTNEFDRFEREPLAELALDYRDKMLRELGVIGVEKHTSPSFPGEKIRRIPMQPGGFDDLPNGNTRVLTDTREYDANTDTDSDTDSDNPVVSKDDVLFATVRETTGPAAIYSSQTTTIGWDTLPTPREIKLAEYLLDIEEDDVKPEGHIPRDDAAEKITRMIFPYGECADRYNLWQPVRDTNIDNETAIRDCVTALTYYDEHRYEPDVNHTYQLLRWEDERYGESSERNADTLRYRFSTDGLIVETHRREKPAWETDVYIGTEIDDLQEVEPDTPSGPIGCLSFDFQTRDGETRSTQTKVMTIPEMKRPEHVLDLPNPRPRQTEQ